MSMMFTFESAWLHNSREFSSCSLGKRKRDDFGVVPSCPAAKVSDNSESGAKRVLIDEEGESAFVAPSSTPTRCLSPVLMSVPTLSCHSLSPVSVGRCIPSLSPISPRDSISSVSSLLSLSRTWSREAEHSHVQHHTQHQPEPAVVVMDMPIGVGELVTDCLSSTAVCQESESDALHLSCHFDSMKMMDDDDDDVVNNGAGSSGDDSDDLCDDDDSSTVLSTESRSSSQRSSFRVHVASSSPLSLSSSSYIIDKLNELAEGDNLLPPQSHLSLLLPTLSTAGRPMLNDHPIRIQRRRQSWVNVCNSSSNSSNGSNAVAMPVDCNRAISPLLTIASALGNSPSPVSRIHDGIEEHDFIFSRSPSAMPPSSPTSSMVQLSTPTISLSPRYLSSSPVPATVCSSPSGSPDHRQHRSGGGNAFAFHSSISLPTSPASIATLPTLAAPIATSIHSSAAQQNLRLRAASIPQPISCGGAGGAPLPFHPTSKKRFQF